MSNRDPDKQISVSSDVYRRLENLAVGFDTPSDVISRLIDDCERRMTKAVSVSPVRQQEPSLHGSENTEIQQRIVSVAKELHKAELERLCDPIHSKEVFNINFPLLKAVSTQSENKSKHAAIKDKGVNRWTRKYEFIRDDTVYFICTQWFSWNDRKVNEWLALHGAERLSFLPRE